MCGAPYNAKTIIGASALFLLVMTCDPEGAFARTPHGGTSPIFRVTVAKNGVYGKTITVPPTLTSGAAISGSAPTKVMTRPGTYYFSISLFDIHLDPVKRALAHVKIVP
jgi:hypothetical protein